MERVGEVVAVEPLPPAAEVLQSLSSAVDAAVAAAPTGHVQDAVVALRLVQRLHGLALRELAALDASGEVGLGRLFPVGLATWLQREQQIGDDAARSTVRLARRLEDELPAVRDALLAGETTLEHVRAVHVGTAGLDRDLVRQAQDALADVARSSEPAAVRRELRERAHAIDPSLGEDAARRQHERRGLSVDRLDGYGVHLRGALGEEDGAVLLLGLQLGVQAERRTSGTDDPRTHGQRQADVVVAWARQAIATHSGPADSAANDAHTVRSSLLIGCTAEQLEAAARESADGTRAGQVRGQDALDLLTGVVPARPAALASLPGTTPLTRGALLWLACDATVSLAVLQLRAAGAQGTWTSGPRVEPLYVGRSSRTITGLQFKALVVRDRHCVVRGCRRPPSVCEGHHVEH